MPYNIVHAGTALQMVNVAGGVTSLTLPTGVTMSSTRRTRFAVIEGSVVAVYGPSVNLRIDVVSGTVSTMSLIAPSGVPTVGAGSAGALTGVYSYKITFAQMDGGVVISESPLTGASANVTVSSQKISLSGIPVSTAASVTARRIYRTTAGGSVYFLADTLTDNTTTTYTDNTPDAGLATVAAPTDLGNPAGTTTSDYLSEIVAWGDRLWATSSGDPDLAFYSGVNKFYAWNALQFLAANPIGQNSTGIVAFLPRRSELGIAKKTGLWKVTGTGSTTFQCQQFWHGVGVKAPESVVVVEDTVYWLAENGVYAWGPDGIGRISERVSPWFTSDTYFNRALFEQAFARWNPRENTYELHLAAPTSGVLDRWVSYDLTQRRWLGPHKTDAFTPSCGGMVEMSAGVWRSLIGSTSGHLYLCNDGTFADGTSAIETRVRTAWHSGGVPELSKVFGKLVMYTGVESSGTLIITPYVGGTDAAASATMNHDLTTGEERLDRLGIGRLASLEFEHHTINERARIYGYQMPVVPVGVR